RRRSSFPKGVVTLDFNITPELKKEGQFRDLTRTVQELRKKAALTPRDTAVLAVSANPSGEAFVRELEAELKRATLLKEVRFEKLEGEPVKIDELEFVLSILR
ncbi:hypothetical protein KW797_03225, partial [Candidatus Parcubacteria bacterium]|nr:hypothetical protein [Candidatus Parcubacteria bacterium]